MPKFIKALIVTLGIFSSTYLFANQYAVVIDGGSSGTRLYVYEKNANGIHKINSLKIKPGISSYNVNNQLEAKRLQKRIKDLLDLAKKNLPQEEWSNIGVTLYATAGMRLEPLVTQKKTYQLIKKVIQDSGLKYNDARTISGGEEGVFMWISVNSDENKIKNDYGILDMGGASTQIAFWNDRAANYEFSHNNNDYKIYSKSFLGLGKNLTISQFLQKPSCFPNGYVSSESHGEWNLNMCEYEINRFIITQHATNKVITPPQTMVFQASDNFYKVFYQALGLNSIILTKLDLPKILSFCESDDDITQTVNDSSIPSEQICFETAYFYTLLASYGFGNQTIELFDNSWTKGVAFVLLNDIEIKSIN